jgi:phosphotransferase system  glucose/maltose/N-acetylglucosamine-specific IIC component
VNWWQAFIGDNLTGWGAAGLLVAVVLLALIFRRLIPLGAHKEIVAFWVASAEKWEKAATELLAQNAKLIASQEISKKFYTEQLAKDPLTGGRVDGTGGD